MRWLAMSFVINKIESVIKKSTPIQSNKGPFYVDLILKKKEKKKILVKLTV